MSILSFWMNSRHCVDVGTCFLRVKLKGVLVHSSQLMGRLMKKFAQVPPIPETVTGANDLSGFIPVTAVTEVHLEEVITEVAEAGDDGADIPLEAEEDDDTYVDGAKNSLPVRMEPIIDQQQLPKRLMQINAFIFIFYQNEWEIARIHKRIQVAIVPTFDIKMCFTNQWAVATLSPENYGKDNASTT